MGATTTLVVVVVGLVDDACGQASAHAFTSDLWEEMRQGTHIRTRAKVKV